MVQEVKQIMYQFMQSSITTMSNWPESLKWCKVITLPVLMIKLRHSCSRHPIWLTYWSIVDRCIPTCRYTSTCMVGIYIYIFIHDQLYNIYVYVSMYLCMYAHRVHSYPIPALQIQHGGPVEGCVGDLPRCGPSKTTTTEIGQKRRNKLRSHRGQIILQFSCW